jgi:hypothetical protein
LSDVLTDFQSARYQNESTGSASNAVQKEHERDRTVSYLARHICAGSNGFVCIATYLIIRYLMGV